MFRHEYLLDVARPPADVYGYLAKVENTPQWLSRCVECRAVDGSVAVGAPLAYAYREGARVGHMAGEVAANEPEKLFEMKYRDKLMHVRVGFAFEAAGAGTKVRHFIEIAPQTFFFRLLQPVIRRATVKQTAKDMATLKELLEKR